MTPLQIVIIEGTRRVQRQSIHAARLVAEVGRGLDGVEITLVDPVDFELEGDGNDPEGKNFRYTAITEKADAFFIVTPEYNHSFPGSLKRLLDSELKNYIHKPVAFAGVSNGSWGGVRAIEALNQTVRELGLVSTFTDVQFPKVQEIFDDEGRLLDPAYEKRITRAYTELIWMARTLQWGRDNLK
ncbi:MAG: NAD(P)H-dependent oxidoreductase [Candidatus Saccharimonadales bacterium]